MTKKKPKHQPDPRVQTAWKYYLIIEGREVTFTGRAPEWSVR